MRNTIAVLPLTVFTVRSYGLRSCDDTKRSKKYVVRIATLFWPDTHSPKFGVSRIIMSDFYKAYISAVLVACVQTSPISFRVQQRKWGTSARRQLF